MDSPPTLTGDLPDPVAADYLESDEAYLLVIDLPGATPENTTISTHGDSIQVETSREESVPAEVSMIREQRPREIAFDLSLPQDADVETAQASLADGVLEISIDKGPSGVSIPIREGSHE